jgi:hypothetical protein
VARWGRVGDVRFGFRNVAPTFPFLWSDTSQPAARWHAAGEGPTHYLADTSDGAWAEFIRHEELDDPQDLMGVERSLWVVELPDSDVDSAEEVSLPVARGQASYPQCQDIARTLRGQGVTALRAPSAAIADAQAGGQRCEAGVLVEGEIRDGEVWVLFGARPDLTGWLCVERGAPPARLLDRVVPLF